MKNSLSKNCISRSIKVNQSISKTFKDTQRLLLLINTIGLNARYRLKTKEKRGWL